jgi:hypothetical protein
MVRCREGWQASQHNVHANLIGSLAATRARPAVFGRKLQCQPVRGVNTRENAIGCTHGSASSGAKGVKLNGGILECKFLSQTRTVHHSHCIVAFTHATAVLNSAFQCGVTHRACVNPSTHPTVSLAAAGLAATAVVVVVEAVVVTEALVLAVAVAIVVVVTATDANPTNTTSAWALLAPTRLLCITHQHPRIPWSWADPTPLLLSNRSFSVVWCHQCNGRVHG